MEIGYVIHSPEVGKDAGILTLGGADETHRRDNWDGEVTGNGYLEAGVWWLKIQGNKEKHVPQIQSLFDVDIYVYKCIDEIAKFEGVQIPFHSVKVPSVFSRLVSQVVALQTTWSGRPFFWLRGFIVDFMYLFFGF